MTDEPNQFVHLCGFDNEGCETPVSCETSGCLHYERAANPHNATDLSNRGA